MILLKDKRDLSDPLKYRRKEGKEPLVMIHFMNELKRTWLRNTHGYCSILGTRKDEAHEFLICQEDKTEPSRRSNLRKKGRWNQRKIESNKDRIKEKLLALKE